MALLKNLKNGSAKNTDAEARPLDFGFIAMLAATLSLDSIQKFHVKAIWPIMKRQKEGDYKC